MLDNNPAHANNHKQILDLISFVILFVNDQWSVMNILTQNESKSYKNILFLRIDNENYIFTFKSISTKQYHMYAGLLLFWLCTCLFSSSAINRH